MAEEAPERTLMAVEICHFCLAVLLVGFKCLFLTMHRLQIGFHFGFDVHQFLLHSFQLFLLLFQHLSLHFLIGGILFDVAQTADEL